MVSSLSSDGIFRVARHGSQPLDLLFDFLSDDSVLGASELHVVLGESIESRSEMTVARDFFPAEWEGSTGRWRNDRFEWVVRRGLVGGDSGRYRSWVARERRSLVGEGSRGERRRRVMLLLLLLGLLSGWNGTMSGVDVWLGWWRVVREDGTRVEGLVEAVRVGFAAEVGRLRGTRVVGDLTGLEESAGFGDRTGSEEGHEDTDWLVSVVMIVVVMMV